MFKNNFKYNRALIRNLFEFEIALSYRNGVNEIVRVAPTTSWSFFSYAYLAMYDALFFHAIKMIVKAKNFVLKTDPNIKEKIIFLRQLTNIKS